MSPPGVGHGKFAVCICPHRLWFMYINSDRPQGRRRAQIAITIAAFEAHFLSKTCYLDTTDFPNLSSAVVNAALAVQKNCLGILPPSIRISVVATVRTHGVLEPEKRRTVLDGEP